VRGKVEPHGTLALPARVVRLLALEPRSLGALALGLVHRFDAGALLDARSLLGLEGVEVAPLRSVRRARPEMARSRRDALARSGSPGSAGLVARIDRRHDRSRLHPFGCAMGPGCTMGPVEPMRRPVGLG
jgi:hypothetical protein